MSPVSLAAYRGLLAEPALRRLAIADACARLPQGMVSITLLLVAAEHASMAVAGLVVAGYALGQAVTGPVRGRLADRYGLIQVAAGCGAGAQRCRSQPACPRPRPGLRPGPGRGGDRRRGSSHDAGARASPVR